MNTVDPDRPDVGEGDAPWAIPLHTRIWIGGMGLGCRLAVERRLRGAHRATVGAIRHLFVTPASGDEAVYFIHKHAVRLTADGMIWVVVPIEDRIQTIGAALEAYGWTQALSASLDDRFAVRGFRRRNQGE